jgi:hypothetical protein
MNRKVIYLLVAVAFVFFITSFIIFLKSRGDIGQKDLDVKEKQVQEEIDEPKILKLKLFYYTGGSLYMKPVSYEIQDTEFKNELYAKIINMLIKGEKNTISPVPEGLLLRSLFYIKTKKMLVLDFNESLISAFPAGSSAELEFIYFIVDNLCFNFEEIKMVKFLIAGNEYKTISGHIDIENPFYPDYRYLRIE